MPCSPLRGLGLAATFAVLTAFALAGASCEKKPKAASPTPGLGDDGAEPVVPTKESGLSAPAHGMPYPDPKLDPDQQLRYDALAEKLPSPCGRPHSLAVSAKTDPSCKRTAFATRYVKKWLAEEIDPDQVTEIYVARFLQERRFPMVLDDAPYEGMPDAKIKVVEFFDYGCPHCAATAPKLEDLVAEFPGDVAVYYKHFPLSAKGGSILAAAAAVAAGKQGKFMQMHRKIFQSLGNHAKEDLFRHAKELGLDMARFEADWNDPATRGLVLADREEGDKLGIEGTPTLFVNGRVYMDQLELEDFRDWVNEELAALQAVN